MNDNLRLFGPFRTPFSADTSPALAACGDSLFLAWVDQGVLKYTIQGAAEALRGSWGDASPVAGSSGEPVAAASVLPAAAVVGDHLVLVWVAPDGAGGLAIQYAVLDLLTRKWSEAAPAGPVGSPYACQGMGLTLVAFYGGIALAFVPPSTEFTAGISLGFFDIALGNWSTSVMALTTDAAGTLQPCLTNTSPGLLAWADSLLLMWRDATVTADFYYTFFQPGPEGNVWGPCSALSASYSAFSGPSLAHARGGVLALGMPGILSTQGIALGAQLFNVSAGELQADVQVTRLVPVDDTTAPVAIGFEDSQLIAYASGGSLCTMSAIDALCVPSAAWMTALMKRPDLNLGERSLSEIVVPGTHDAAMYDSGLIYQAFGAITQDQDLFAQLSGGVRYFDLRPAYHAPERMTLHGHFYLHHGAASGPRLSTVLADIRRFMLQPDTTEVVVLKFSHYKNFGQQQTPNAVYDQFLSEIVKALGEFLYVCDDQNVDLSSIPLNALTSGGTNVALVVLDGMYLVNNPALTYPGIYTYRDGAVDCPNDADRNYDPAQGQLVVYDCYSNTTKLNDMIEGQTSLFESYTGVCGGPYSQVSCGLFLLSWTLTPWGSSVYRVAGPANVALQSVLFNDIQQPNAAGKVINVIYLDFYEYSGVTSYCVWANAYGPG